MAQTLDQLRTQAINEALEEVLDVQLIELAVVPSHLRTQMLHRGIYRLKRISHCHAVACFLELVTPTNGSWMWATHRGEIKTHLTIRKAQLIKQEALPK